MSSGDFEKLDVYRLAEKLGDEVWAIVTGSDYFTAA
jgi:hypothetical protein